MVAKFATNASGAMLLLNLILVTESISGSVVPLAMFLLRIFKIVFCIPNNEISYGPQIEFTPHICQFALTYISWHRSCLMLEYLISAELLDIQRCPNTNFV